METQETTTSNVGLSTETPAPAAIEPSPADKPVVQEWVAVGRDFLARMYEYLSEFISDNEKILVNLLLLFLAVIAVRVILAVLTAINDFPLLSPFFELIGLGYTGWFVYRYLWKESNRQELKSEINALKSQIIGRDGSVD